MMNLQHITQTPGQVASFNLTLPYIADPLQSFAQVCSHSQSSLLLESAEIDSKDNLKSLMLIDAALRIECLGLEVRIDALTTNGATLLPFLQQQLTGLSQSQTLDGQRLTVHFAKADP